MPELPEVESLRLALQPVLRQSTVQRVVVSRADVIAGDTRPAALLARSTVTGLLRHGKQLAIVARDARRRERCLCIHLGMSGTLQFHGKPLTIPHCHITWRFAGGHCLTFRDPRRFGGIWTFPSAAALVDERWSRLGPDALTITPTALRRALSRTRRALKAAMLDQAVLAGLGNIYVDELLFDASLHPLTQACSLTGEDCRRLVRRMRLLLRRAIAQGGSTLRDHRRADGRPGAYQQRHRVYGRAGEPCVRCGRTLQRLLVAARGTTFCPHCQPGPDMPTVLQKTPDSIFDIPVLNRKESIPSSQ